MLANLFVLLANAQANPPAPPGGATGGGGLLGGYELPFMLMALFALMWLFVFRPQQAKAKEQKAMLNTLKKNDEVITAGGIIGTVVNVKEKAGGIAGDEDVITIRLDGQNRMQVIRSSITKVLKADEGKKEAETTAK